MTPAKKPATKAAPTTARAAKGAGHSTSTSSPPAKKARRPRLPKPKWDVSDVQEWGPDKHELGATIPEAGNSIYNETGGWRTYVPEIDVTKCNGCMLCYFYCPDAAIVVENGKAVGIDLLHCKGCGICAQECPQKAIRMLLEEKE